MDIIDKILEKHTKIMDTEEVVNEVYMLDAQEDVELYLTQHRDRITIATYSTKRGRNIGMQSNFKKLWRGFKKVAKDGYISREKGDYRYRLTLLDKTAPKAPVVVEDVEVIEELGVVSGIEKIDGLELEQLKQANKMLLDENSKLRAKNSELEDTAKNLLELLESIKSKRGNAGRKTKPFKEEDIAVMRSLKAGGTSTREIAKEYKCSHTLVNKLIKLHSE